MKDTRIIVIYNNKGGVGKTTTTINLADALHLRGFKTLVIDMDPQANTTFTFGVNTDGIATMTNVLDDNDLSIDEVIVKTNMGDIAPTDFEMNGLSEELSGVKLGLLKNKVEEIKENYDFILIDTPPNLGAFTLSALLTGNEYIIAISGDTFAMKGIQNAFTGISQVMRINKSLKYDGILMTAYDSRRKTKDVAYWVEIVETADNLKPFSRPIRVDSNVGKAQESRVSLQEKFHNSPAAVDYRQIADEIIMMGE